MADFLASRGVQWWPEDTAETLPSSELHRIVWLQIMPVGDLASASALIVS